MTYQVREEFRVAEIEEDGTSWSVEQGSENLGEVVARCQERNDYYGSVGRTFHVQKRIISEWVNA